MVLSDAEAWTHQVAQSLHIPRISIDHIGIMAYCWPQIEWHDRPEAAFDTLVYRTLMGQPQRVVVSSFYEAPPRRPGVRVVGTLVRPQVHEFAPTDGDHLLAYFNQGRWQLNKRIMRTLQECGCPVRLFGGQDCGRVGNITFRPLSNLPFLEDLASCRGVISTAGNQLMGEAIFLGKPVLVMPEACVEQRPQRGGGASPWHRHAHHAEAIHVAFAADLPEPHRGICRQHAPSCARRFARRALCNRRVHGRTGAGSARASHCQFGEPLMQPVKLALAVLRNHVGAVPRPSWCTYLVCYRCNARCKMCDSWRMKPGAELTAAQVRTIFEKIGRLDIVRLTGGEPFLRDDLLDVATAIAEASRPDVIHITSNGSFPERIEAFARQFPRPNKLRFMISVDGLADEHDANRGAEVSFASVRESVARLVSLGQKVSINHTVISEQSLRDHDALCRLFEKDGVDIHCVLAYADSAMYGRKRVGTKAEDLIAAVGYPLHPQLKDADVVGFTRRLLRGASKMRDPLLRVGKRYYLRGLLARLQQRTPALPHPKCVAVRSHIRLLPDGGVPVCQFNTEQVGNLLTQSFEEVWSGAAAKAARQWVDACPGCWAECEVMPSAIYSGDLLRNLF